MVTTPVNSNTVDLLFEADTHILSVSSFSFVSLLFCLLLLLRAHAKRIARQKQKLMGMRINKEPFI